MGFWLIDILDNAEVNTIDQLSKALRNRRFAKEIFEVARAEDRYTLTPVQSPGTTILAGHNLDLSGSLSVFNSEFLQRDLDRLLSRTWFYFDHVAVRGPSKKVVREISEMGFSDNALHHLEALASTLLYARSIGVDDFLVFTEKAPACGTHYRQHLSEAGLENVLNGADEVISMLAREGTIRSVSPQSDHIHCAFDHPLLEHTQWPCLADVPVETKNLDIIARAAAESIFAKYASYLTSDVMTARGLHTPLGMATAIGNRLMSPLGPTEAGVALALDLPVLTGAPTREIAAIRDSERESFRQFQFALRSAVKEALKDHGGTSTQEIATEIKNDIIAPALNEINQIVSKSRDLLKKKMFMSVGFGLVTTAVGQLIKAPMFLTPAGITLIFGGSATAWSKQLEEARDVELEDMYFLWSREVQSRG